MEWGSDLSDLPVLSDISDLSDTSDLCVLPDVHYSEVDKKNSRSFDQYLWTQKL